MAQQLTIPSGTVTRIAIAGPRDFLHVQNNSAVTIYITYDGSVPVGATGLYGYPLAGSGGVLRLDNDDNRPVFNKDVYAYQASGSSQFLVVQGI